MTKTPSEVLDGLSFSNIKGNLNRIDRINAHLSAVLPDVIKEHVYLAAIDNDTGTISAEHPAWLTRARFLQNTILMHLQDHPDSTDVTSLQFRLYVKES